MKNKWLIFTMLFNLLMGCGSTDAREIPERKRVVHGAIRKIADEIEGKYELYFSGIEEEADHDNNFKYKSIGVFFTSNKYISKADARRIIVDITNVILEKLNNKEVQPFLTVNPFTEKNIRTCVFIKVPTKNWDYSQIYFFGNRWGNIYYTYQIPNEKFKVRDEEESLQEAKKILEQEGNCEQTR